MTHKRLVWLSFVVAGLLGWDRSAEQAIQPNVPLNVYVGNLHSHTA